MNGEAGDDRTRSAARLEGRRRADSTACRSDGLVGRRRGLAATRTSSVHEIGGETANTRAALFVDARATTAQRKALVAMVKTLASGRRRHRRPKSRPRRFSSSTAATTIRVATKTLRLTVEKHMAHDASCGNKQWFEPLVERATTPRWGRPPRTRSAARRSARSGATRTSARRSSEPFLTRQHKSVAGRRQSARSLLRVTACAKQSPSSRPPPTSRNANPILTTC